jgi:hypothetical protein
MAITSGITQQGLIPATTPFSDKKGVIVNSWYHWLKVLSNNQQTIINGGPYIAAGGGSGVTPTLSEGTLAERPAGVNGEIYFTTDTGQIFINVSGEWTELIPAFTGDVTSTVGSTELTLKVVNPITFGSFTNISALTVNDKGLVTNVASGPSNSTANGPPGSIQYAGVGGGFVGDSFNFFYTHNSTQSTIQLGNTVGIGQLTLGSDGANVLGDTSGNLKLATTNGGLQINTSGALSPNITSPNYGTAGQVLTSEGSSASPQWVAIPPPALTSTYVGYGDASNILTGTSNFTWTNASSTLTLNSAGSAKIQFAGTDSIFDNGSGGMAITAANNLYAYAGTGNIYLYPGTSGTGYILEAGGDLNIAGTSGTSGQILTSQGIGAFPTWTTIPTGTPGGSNTDVQFNNSGAFGGAADIQYYFSNPYPDPNYLLINCVLVATEIYAETPTPTTSSFAKIFLNSDQITLEAGASGTSPLNFNGEPFFNTPGAFIINGDGGTSGYVLTSTGSGSGTPPIWAPLAPTYTLSTLPTAVAGLMITVTDANSGSGALCYCIGDGIWRDAGTHILVA